MLNVSSSRFDPNSDLALIGSRSDRRSTSNCFLKSIYKHTELW